MLQVIGLGYPRTGTMSLKHALEELQLGPCYHMIEVFDRPGDVEFWLSALANNGQDADWDMLFEEFQSTSDCPACYFWESLWRHFPNAKYILTVRDADTWYDSFHATVYEAMTHPERAPDQQHLSVQNMARKLILGTMLEGRFEDREFAIDRFQAHNQSVVDMLPQEQLLIFDVAAGWEPLCRFLSVDVPDSPFPRSNTRAEFQQLFSVVPPPEI